MTKAERELLLFVAEALATPWSDTVSGTSWHGEKSQKAHLRELIEEVRFGAARDVTQDNTPRLTNVR